jgi:hypothetical protein
MRTDYELLGRIKEVRSRYWEEPTDQELRNRFLKLSISESVYPLGENLAVTLKK